MTPLVLLGRNFKGLLPELENNTHHKLSEAVPAYKAKKQD